MLKEPNLFKPASHSLISEKLTYGGYLGLFDGKHVNEWNTTRIAYFGKLSNYIELEIFNNSNFYRKGTTTWKQYYGTLTIFKYNEDGTYTDVTDLYTLPGIVVTENEWALFAQEVPKGRYKFELTNTSILRLDSEWFIEKGNEGLTNSSIELNTNGIVTMNFDLGVTFLKPDLTQGNVIQKIYNQDDKLIMEKNIPII